MVQPLQVVNRWTSGDFQSVLDSDLWFTLSSDSIGHPNMSNRHPKHI
jgi:hypothetical protein